MRILLVTPDRPSGDGAHGGGVYLGALATALAAHAELGLACLADRSTRTAPPAGPWAWHSELPYLGQGRHDGDRAHRMRMLWHWRRDPLLVAKHWHPQMPRALRAALAAFRPDVALVEMAQMAQYLPHLRSIPTVLTDHEAGQPANASTGLGALADRRDAVLWQRYVRRRYALATRVQALTVEDAAALEARIGRPVQVRPPACPLPAAAVAPERAGPHALFLGDYRHQPNVEAAQRLVRDVWPLVRRARPEAELLLAGPNDARLGSLGGDGVRIVGFVSDLPALLGRVRVLLAPLWSGAGFRVKVATALAHGLPVVTNRLGGRGCDAPEPARTLAETPEGLAAATVALLQAPADAAKAGAAAHAWARGHLAPAAVAARQLDLLRSLLADHRAG
jgi:glycosyltransferase involved in cell wall biosynthesis